MFIAGAAKILGGHSQGSAQAFSSVHVEILCFIQTKHVPMLPTSEVAVAMVYLASPAVKSSSVTAMITIIDGEVLVLGYWKTVEEGETEWHSKRVSGQCRVVELQIPSHPSAFLRFSRFLDDK